MILPMPVVPQHHAASNRCKRLLASVKAMGRTKDTPSELEYQIPWICWNGMLVCPFPLLDATPISTLRSHLLCSFQMPEPSEGEDA